ncbi:MAG: HAMP domain-containing protein, partial [Chlamydiia bacterium]|nr:HAMP domain-containing protein [Chlamydiia bacterium]
MTTRTRLLLFLVPTFVVVLIVTSLFFFLQWNSAIKKNSRDILQTITVSVANQVKAEDVYWIAEHIKTPELLQSPIYRWYEQTFRDIEKELPIDSLYLVRLERVKKGELILPNKPRNNENRELKNGYRQLILIDPDANPDLSKAHPLFGYDYSENEEQQVYQTKEPYITSIYTARGTETRFMTGFAPVFDANDENVIALVAADLSLEVYDQMQRRALLILVFADLSILILMIFLISLIAHKSTRGLLQLKNAALEVAAGNYEQHIDVRGPKEIAELANSFNTMSDCLIDNLRHVQESTLEKEKRFGEYECAQFLQNRMLNQPIHNFTHRQFSLHLLTHNLTPHFKGLLFHSTPTSLTLFEAEAPSLDGIYTLLSSPPTPNLTLELTLPLNPTTHHFPTPLLLHNTLLIFNSAWLPHLHLFDAGEPLELILRHFHDDSPAPLLQLLTE